MRSVLLIVMAFVISTASLSQSTNGLCCDPDSPSFNASNSFSCASTGEDPSQQPFSGPGNCDSDCGEITGDCTTIPIDGGLSLLALAGGGLATAAMRRRREEEARQADES